MGTRGPAARRAQRRAPAHDQGRSPADGRTIDELAGFPGDAWVSFVVRDGHLVPITSDSTLQAGDDVLVLADAELQDQLIAAFEGPAAQ